MSELAAKERKDHKERAALLCAFFAFFCGYEYSLSCQDNAGFFSQFHVDRFRRAHAIKDRETVGGLQMPKSFFDGPLVLHEAIEHIARKADIHPALPIVERHVLGEVPLNEFLGWHVEIKYSVRFKRNAVDVFEPRFVHAANHVARHQRVDVAIGEDNKASLQCRQNDVFELVGEVRSIKQAERRAAQNIAFLGAIEFFANESGAFQPDLDGGMSAAL